jgi:hypothetical protein
MQGRGRERGRHHEHAKAVDVGQLRVALVAEELLCAGRFRSHAARCALVYMYHCGTMLPTTRNHAASTRLISIVHVCTFAT